MKTILYFALFSALVVTNFAIDCVPCDDATCIPPPPGCELGRRVCSCCEECRVTEGGACGPFTPECRSDLVCFTSVGVFVGRPPWELTAATGTCISFEDVPEGALHSVG